MKRFSTWVVLAGILAGSGFLAWRLFRKAPGVRAENSCTDASFQGPFGYVLKGNVSSNGNFGVFASSGRLVSDGMGRFEGTESASLNGEVFRRVYTGIYKVAANCTGSAILNDNLGSINNFDFILVDGGKKVRFIETDPGTAVTGTFEPQ